MAQWAALPKDVYLSTSSAVVAAWLSSHRFADLVGSPVYCSVLEVDQEGV